MAASEFKIDLTEAFPNLATPPIVEAILYWVARPRHFPGPDDLRQAIAKKLPAYDQFQILRNPAWMTKFTDGEVETVVHQRKEGFQGFRLSAPGGAQSAQFKRDGLVFSLTNHYDHWDSFTASAKEAWQAYREITQPPEIEKLGVRFINHFPLAAPGNLREYLRDPPTCPAGLPLREFLYQSTFMVPGEPFSIRVVKVMQPAMEGIQNSSGVFVDCDVFTKGMLPVDADLEDALARLRWLKNKVFFSLIAGQALLAFQGAKTCR